jgi:aquaporin Z
MTTATMNEGALTIPASTIDVLKQHWPEYLMEAFGLGLFMASACSFAVLLEHPASPVHQALPDVLTRRVLMGTAMGLTAILNIYSPWGKRSGAHLNPSTTLAFLRLGKVRPLDAMFYTIAQFAGGIIGTLLAAGLVPSFVGHPTVNYAATVPGSSGIAIAFVAEVVISFVLMSVVLRVSNASRLSRSPACLRGR